MYKRWVTWLGPLPSLLVLAINASVAVLGLVWLWPIWWITTAINTLLLLFWYWEWRHRTQYATLAIEVVIVPSEEE